MNCNHANPAGRATHKRGDTFDYATRWTTAPTLATTAQLATVNAGVQLASLLIPHTLGLP